MFTTNSSWYQKFYILYDHINIYNNNKTTTKTTTTTTKTFKNV